MTRRTTLQALAASTLAVRSSAAAPKPPIVLLVDLEVPTAKERELERVFRNTFRPTISKQNGFVDVKLMKLRQEIQGKAPESCRWRLLISFQTEEQRLKWVASEDHQRAWPAIESVLGGQKVATVLLYDPLD